MTIGGHSDAEQRSKEMTAKRPGHRPVFMAMMVSGIVISAAFTSIAVVYGRGVDAFRQQFRENLLRLTQSAASQVDVSAHQRIVSPSQQDSPEFAYVIAPLRRMLQSVDGVKYIYTAVLRSGRVYFIADSAGAGDHDGDGRDDQAKIMEYYAEAEPALVRCLKDGVAGTSDQPYVDPWGTFMSGYVPLHDDHGRVVAAVAVDFMVDEYTTRLAAMSHAAYRSSLPAFLIALLSGLGVYSASRSDLAARRYREQAQSELRARADELLCVRDAALLARREAELANQTKSQFLANMSHEMRTPLTAILGFADILVDNSPVGSVISPVWRRNALQSIQRNGQHLLSLINDILDLSRIEAGKLNVERVIVDAHALIGEIVDLMQMKLAERPVSLRVEWDSGAPHELYTDPVRLRQILTNLIGNAVKFTEFGEIRVRTALVDLPDNSPKLEVTVSDTGIGMSMEQSKRLFQPFVQMDNSMSRRYGGSGLGLMISKHLAQLLGGDISVLSEVGKGSQFRLTVDVLELPAPLVQGDQVSDGPLTSSSTARQSLHDARILLVEDGIDNQRLIAFILRRAGANVEVAENGRLAIEQLTVDGTVSGLLRDPPPFDLIIMDMQMPEMDGYDATCRLRKLGCHLPIVALTANAMAGEGQRCRAAGCSDYLTKPIERSSFIERLTQWIPAEAPASVAGH